MKVRNVVVYSFLCSYDELTRTSHERQETIYYFMGSQTNPRYTMKYEHDCCIQKIPNSTNERKSLPFKDLWIPWSYLLTTSWTKFIDKLCKSPYLRWLCISGRKSTGNPLCANFCESFQCMGFFFFPGIGIRIRIGLEINVISQFQFMEISRGFWSKQGKFGSK